MAPLPGLLSCWRNCKQQASRSSTSSKNLKHPTESPRNFSAVSDTLPLIDSSNKKENDVGITRETDFIRENSNQFIIQPASSEILLSQMSYDDKYSVDGHSSAPAEEIHKSGHAVPLITKPLSSHAFPISVEPQKSHMSILPTYRHPLNLPAVPSYHHRRTTRVNFEVPGPAEQIFRKERLPSQVIDLLVFLAREAIAVRDLFRRPGSVHDMKRILRQLRDGAKVSWTQFSFHTLANVAKRFLLSVQGGILGLEAEKLMIAAMKLETPEMTMESMHRVIISLSLPVQCLLVLLFGTWFRMMYHSDVNNMSLEAVAKSVAGSVFLNSCAHLDQVEQATQTMQFLICAFPRSALFGPQLLHYFTQRSKTNINGVERYQYSLICPPNVPRQECVREFVRILKRESDRHHFDLLRDVVTREQFDSACENDESQNALPFHQFQIHDLMSNRNVQIDVTSPTVVPFHLSADDLQSDNLSNYAPRSTRHSCPSQELIPNSLQQSHDVIGEEEDIFRDSPSHTNEGNPLFDSCYSLDNTSLHQRYMERLRKRSSWFLQDQSSNPQSPRFSEFDASPTGSSAPASGLPQIFKDSERIFSLDQVRQESVLLEGIEEDPDPLSDSYVIPETSLSEFPPHLSALSNKTNITVRAGSSVNPQLSNQSSDEVVTVYFVVKRSYGPL